LSNTSVLVSGAAGGIGKATALALAARGFKVFAGALNQAEADSLAGLGLVPTVLDISDIESIEAAIAGIPALDALVNVAGVNYNAPLHVLSLKEIRQMVEVNLLGSMLLTRAALPMLLAAKGRVVLVGSATAFLPPPTISVYAATKCGISGFGDSLRMELGMAGLKVSVVEPGVVRTPMTATGPAVLSRMLERMETGERTLYEKLMRKIVAMSTKESASVPPETVAAAIVDALTAERPRARYRVGVDSKIAAVLRHLPDGARDFVQRKTFGI
jgi:NAD(P)-dependent dehydrogenase (short-subunit alcohol dehydrogenase family)